MVKSVKVSTLYKYAIKKEVTLLGSESYRITFWPVYIENHMVFDIRFISLYGDYYYVYDDALLNFIDEGEVIDSAYNTFSYMVMSFIHSNYTELNMLFLPFEIASSGSSIKQLALFTEYIHTEEKTEIEGETSSDSEPYVDNIHTSKTGKVDDGKSGSDTVQYGETTTDTVTSNPQKTDIITEKVSAFDASDFSNRQQTEHMYSSFAVDATGTTGEHTDTTTYNTTNTINRNLEDHTNLSYARRRKTDANRNTENKTYDREGYDRPISEVFNMHVDFWKMYSFYDMLFRRIADDLLYAENPLDTEVKYDNNAYEV